MGKRKANEDLEATLVPKASHIKKSSLKAAAAEESSSSFKVLWGSLLFSDSVKNAKDEDHKKITNGKPKKLYHGQLAAAIFDIPEGVEHSKYSANTSVLQKTYAKLNKELGQAGVRLDPEQVIPDSDIVNMLNEICKDFPWWDQLNPLWCEMPRYTTHLITNSASGVAKLWADLEELVLTPSAVDTINDVPANDIPDFEPLPISLGEDSENEDQTCQDVDQWHMENMAKIKAKSQHMAMKHKIKLAELAYHTAELSCSLAGSSSSASPLMDHTSYPSSPKFDPFPLTHSIHIPHSSLDALQA
ncbi:hypothetical protein BS47DRAFT_1362140 [Hydnum rufescens UP504]|uniref:Uncharacterized protein n=1 Tax=Hydnum rufescens UP504 TaxID=1448309 RepID=A0A9P6DWR7_9AGAM|nr:hypothetical protein BS47DRAFT_1362140 [Hydnum rufescens UP504]